MKRLATVLSLGAALLFGGYVPSAMADTKTPSPAPTTTSAPSAPTAAAGTFCSKDLEGKTGNASDGSTLTCTAGSDGRDRWTAK
ncbi:exoglucanase 1 [Mycobacterium sp. CBMA334]|nr:exoglucanase 1 [Mycolicibacterium sp. CBMA 334]